jgi:hypothetical protein
MPLFTVEVMVTGTIDVLAEDISGAEWDVTSRTSTNVGERKLSNLIIKATAKKKDDIVFQPSDIVTTLPIDMRLIKPQPKK